jgi:hypothetical protein
MNGSTNARTAAAKRRHPLLALLRGGLQREVHRRHESRCLVPARGAERWYARPCAVDMAPPGETDATLTA